MDNSSQTTEKIIQYLDGELTGKELNDFQELLSRDTQLQAELAQMKLAREAVEHYGLKQQVASVHMGMMAELKEHPSIPSGAKVYSLLHSVMRIAAILLLFIISFGAYEFISVKPGNLLSNETAYTISVARGSAETSAIEKAYSEKDYEAVVSIFEKEKKPSVKDRFLGAQAYLAVNEPVKAIEQFNEVLVSGNNEYKDDAEYYSAISFLQNNQPMQAKVWLEKIQRDKDHLYHNQVTYFTLLKLNMLILKINFKKK